MHFKHFSDAASANVRAGITLNSDQDWLSLVKASHAPPGAESHQTWAKQLPGGAMAVLFVNGGPENSTASFSSSLASLGLTAPSYAVRDIWRRADMPKLSAGGAVVAKGVAGHDSVFLKLTPAAA